MNARVWTHVAGIAIVAAFVLLAARPASRLRSARRYAVLLSVLAVIGLVLDLRKVGLAWGEQAWALTLLGWTACLCLLAATGRTPGRGSMAWRHAGAAVGFVCVVLAVLWFCPLTFSALNNARRAACSNNLRAIGRAMHAYHDAYGCFPAAVVVDGKGNAMHSWTVHLLPFLGHSDLYSAYNFGKAYSDAANSTVGQCTVAQYQCPARPGWGPDAAACLDYAMLSTPGAIGGVNRYVSMGDITDGPANTIVIVEDRGSQHGWTVPRVVVDPDKELARITDREAFPHLGELPCLLADGQVRRLSCWVRSDVLLGLCTMSGGEAPVDVNEWCEEWR